MRLVHLLPIVEHRDRVLVRVVDHLELEPFVPNTISELRVVVVPELSVVCVDHSCCGLALASEDLHDAGACGTFGHAEVGDEHVLSAGPAMPKGHFSPGVCLACLGVGLV